MIVKNINIEELTITTPREYKNKYKKGQKAELKSFMRLNEDRFSLRTPCLKNTFGLKQFTNKNDNKGMDAYSLNLSAIPYDNIDENKEAVSVVFDELEALDNKMLEFGVEHSKIIFGKEYKDKAVVEALYTKTVKKSEDKDGNPFARRITMKIKPMFNSRDRPNVQVYLNSHDDVNDENFTFEDLTNLLKIGSYAEVILEPQYLVC